MTQSTLFEKSAKQKFSENLFAGIKQYCPTCDRQALLTKSCLNSTLVWMLIRLYRVSLRDFNKPREWVHINKFSPRQHSSGRNFCIVHHWGLAISKSAAPEEDKKTAGEWRLSEIGVEFIKREIRIPKYLFIFNNKVVRKGTDMWGIDDALQKRFEYRELMEAP